jgi:hypothetical protein
MQGHLVTSSDAAYHKGQVAGWLSCELADLQHKCVCAFIALWIGCAAGAVFCIKFFWKLGQMATEFYEIVQQAFRDIAILKVAALPRMIHTQTSHQRCQSMRLLPCQRINAWEPAFNNQGYCHWAQYFINHGSNGTDVLGKWCHHHTKHYYYRKWNGCVVTILQQNKCPNGQCCHHVGQRNLGKLKTKTILFTFLHVEGLVHHEFLP